MGHWEYERGEIILPTAEFAALRQKVQHEVHDHRVEVFGATQEFWKGLTRKEQTDPEAYRAALRRLEADRRRAQDAAGSRWGYSRDLHKEQVADEVHSLLYWKVSGGKAPTRVLKTDVDFPTNRTTEFRAGEGSLKFDRDTSTVHWTTGQNREAIDRARQSPAGRAFFERLRAVKWTRGTGGIFHGDNEISHEETDFGERVTTAFGPIGAVQEPMHTEEYTDSKGHRVTRRELADLQQKLWAEQAKLQQRMARAVSSSGSRRAKTSAASNRGSFASFTRDEPAFRL